MTHALTLRVYYEDVDLAGIVYYANYLRFYERGRSEALRAAGIDQSALRAAGLVFVVVRVEADYLLPARYDDALRVETAAEEIRAATLVLAQRILREADGALLNRARIRVAAMDLEGRPKRLPRAVRAAFTA